MIMRKHQLPYCTIFLSLVTLLYSTYLAFDLTGSLFGKIRILDLEGYGGVRFEHLASLEFWRLFSSQIIHVKQPHMLFNVTSLLILGFFVERYIGFVRMFILWFIAGTAGTLFSTLFVTPPWNLGTGASQAIMGVAAFGVILSYRNIDSSKGLKYAIAFAVAPALLLDLIFAHYPKPGHVLSFVVGWLIGLCYLKQISSKAALNASSLDR